MNFLKSESSYWGLKTVPQCQGCREKQEATSLQIIKVGDQDFLVEHALPFAPRSVHTRRPPIEETMHEHWKKTANLAPVMKRDRSKM